MLQNEHKVYSETYVDIQALDAHFAVPETLKPVATEKYQQYSGSGDVRERACCYLKAIGKLDSV